MKTQFITQHFYKLFLPIIIANIFLYTYVYQEEKKYISSFMVEENKVKSTTDLSQIDCLNESNKKTMALATLAYDQIKDSKKLHLILKIKRDQQKIDSELKYLTEKNLFIIPNYDLNINTDSINGNNSDFYLLKALKNQINNQITVYDQTDKKIQNVDFKIFTIKSKKILHDNVNVLENVSSN